MRIPESDVTFIVLSVYLLTLIHRHWTPVIRKPYGLCCHPPTTHPMDHTQVNQTIDIWTWTWLRRIYTIYRTLKCGSRIVDEPTFRDSRIKHCLVHLRSPDSLNMCFVPYLARFLCYWRRKPAMTLKSGFRMRQGHYESDISEFFPCHFLLIINYNRERNSHCFRDSLR